MTVISLKAQQARIKASSKSKASKDKDKDKSKKHASVKGVLPGVPIAAAPEPAGAQAKPANKPSPSSGSIGSSI